LSKEKSHSRLCRESYRSHGGRIWQIARRTRRDPRELLDFSANINPLGPSPKALSAIRESLWKLPHYPDSDSTPLRQAIARRLSTALDSVVAGNGSTEIIHLFAEANFQGKGEIVIPQPTFAEYEAATRRFGGKPRFVFSGRKWFCLPFDKVVARVGSKTEGVFICNPNNPTGELIERNRMLELIEKTEEKNVPILIDETFIEFSEREKNSSLTHFAPKFPNLVVLRSFTKMYALTGLRVGFAIGHTDMIEPILRRKEPWNVNCLAEAGALASLGDEDYVRRTRELVQKEKLFLQDRLDRIPGLRPFPSEANFILVSTQKTGKTSREIQSSLLRKGIIVRDCSSFRGLGDFFIRVAVKRREHNETLIKALVEIVT